MPTVNDILLNLRPDSIGDIFTYSILLLSVVTLFLLASGNSLSQYLIFGTLILGFVDLLRTGLPNFANSPTGDPLFADTGFGTFILHVAMAILLASVAGAAKVRGRKGEAARPVAILATLVATGYTIASFVQPELIYLPRF